MVANINFGCFWRGGWADQDCPGGEDCLANPNDWPQKTGKMFERAGAFKCACQKQLGATAPLGIRDKES